MSLIQICSSVHCCIIPEPQRSLPTTPQDTPSRKTSLKCPHLGEDCPILGYYAARSGNFSPSFLDNQSVPSSWVKNPSFNFQVLRTQILDSWSPKMGTISCPETSVWNYRYTLRDILQKHFSSTSRQMWEIWRVFILMIIFKLSVVFYGITNRCHNVQWSFISLQVHSTCLGRHTRPSSGVQS